MSRYETLADGTPILDKRGEPTKTFLPRVAGRPGMPQTRPLYRLPDWYSENRVVLVEGEKCADALHERGISATSIMGGANAALDKVDWTPIAGKQVVIWPDWDAPGFAWLHAIAPLLQQLRCTVTVVTPPEEKPKGWDAADCIAEGEDPEALIAGAKPFEAEPEARGNIRVLGWDDLGHLSKPSWSIDGIVSETGLTVLYGKPGSLKSFVAIDMMLSIATGSPWHGRETKPGAVVYVTAEGEAELAKRARGWWASKAALNPDLPKPRFSLVPHALDLTDRDVVDQLIETLDALPERPTQIVLDTLARTFGAKDENSTTDMNAYVAAIDRLREHFRAHVMIVHHSGKDDTKGERGNSALRGAADTVIKITYTGGSVRIINQAPEGKQRNSGEFETITMRRAPTRFEYDGETLDTIVLVKDEEMVVDDKGVRPAEPARKPGKNQVAILAALDGHPEGLGFTALHTATGINRGSLSTTALQGLCKKNAIRERIADRGGRVWTLYVDQRCPPQVELRLTLLFVPPQPRLHS